MVFQSVFHLFNKDCSFPGTYYSQAVFFIYPFFFITINLFGVHVCGHCSTYVEARGQRTLVRSQFFPSILWVIGIKPKWLGLVTSAYTVEPSYQAIIFRQELLISTPNSPASSQVLGWNPGLWACQASALPTEQHSQPLPGTFLGTGLHSEQREDPQLRV